MQLKKVIWAGILGNALELYDFALYGYFAAIISTQFFNSDDVFMNLIATYSIYAIGFLFRPLGAIMFGYIGDRFGRKTSLEISILLMAIPTFCIGLIPSYNIIGAWATVLLISMRVFQGISIGGELVGSYTYLVEHAPPGKKGVTGSWTVVGSFGGKLLGTIAAGATTMMLSTETLNTIGWRIPFLLGVFLAIAGYSLRKKVDETPIFQELKKSKQLSKNPLIDSIKNEHTQILRVIGCLIFHTAALHTLFVYFPVYISTYYNIDFSYALASNFASIAISTLFLIIGGSLSDRFGRAQIMAYSSLVLTIMIFPAFWLISTGGFITVLTVQLLLSMVFGIMHGPFPSFIIEAFPDKIRYTSTALAYNLAVGIFGGLSPLMSTWLIILLKSPLAPCFWLIGCGITSFLSTWYFIQEPQHALKNEPNEREFAL